MLKDTKTIEEKLADIHEINKKSIANLIQDKLTQFHELLKIEKKINDTPINVINKSVKDLLIIIRKGIDAQIKIRIL